MKKIPSIIALASASLICSSIAHSATVIGMSFTREYQDPQVSDGIADGLLGWTDSWLVPEGNFSNVGTNASLTGSATVKMSWDSSALSFGGLEGNNEEALYRSFLDDGDLGDGIGVRVSITGLLAWIASEGMSSYQIRAYASTSTDNATFHQISIKEGLTVAGQLLGTIDPVVMGPGSFPTSSDGTWQPRGFADSQLLVSDSVTLTIPVRDNNIRGSLAAIKITAIPEPSVTLYGMIALLGLLRRNRN